MFLAILAPTAVAETPPDPESTVQHGLEVGSVGSYVARALDQSPEVRAAFQRWESAVHRVARARALPEPTLQFGVFLRSVETRVGPQQARISVQQAFPWPTKLTAGGQAASAEARSAEAMLEATSLAVALRVELAFWSLWEIRATRALHGEHLDVLTGLSETVRSRVEIGAATLADLQQVDLSRARLEDRIRSMDEGEKQAEAALRAAVGGRSVDPTPTVGEPILNRVQEAALQDAVLLHPSLEALELRADAADARARSTAANRLPSFTVGGDWIVTGPAVMPDQPESGKDAVMVGVGLRVPLWQGLYTHEVAAERAAAEAVRADQQARGDRAVADLEAVLAQLRDSERRSRVLSETLLPQARAAYASVLGNYTVGQSAVAQTLLSQRDLLDLGVERAKALADHQRAWAQLDQLVGRAVPRAASDQENAP